MKAQGVALIQTRDALARLPSLSGEGIGVERAWALVRGQVSKLQPCLTEDMEEMPIVDALLDVEGTKRSVMAGVARTD